MHDSAKLNGQLFFDTYVNNMVKPIVIELGSQDINGSLREFSNEGMNYIGIDFFEGKGVDIVLADPYQIPLDDQFADVVITSSCFEHSEMFWIVFIEALRILKSNGILYINAPSN